MKSAFPKAFYWPGAKWWMLPILHRYLPPAFNAVRIPFCGRLDFLHILRSDGFEGHAFCSDLNHRIVEAHVGMRDCSDGVIRELEIHRTGHTSDYYIKIRDRHSPDQPIASKAADFIYLSRSTHKGILKQSKDGAITASSANRPFGFDPTVIRTHSKVLRNTTIVQEDFAATMIMAKPGELVLADPEYLDSPVYGVMGFTAADQIRLAHACRRLHGRGVNFLVTNSDEPFIRHLYSDFVITPVMAPRVLGQKLNDGTQIELVITNY